MKFSKPQHLLILTAPVKFGRASHLGVTVGFGFRLGDPRVLAHETEVWSALEEAPMSFRALDEAMPKAFAEWMLAGHAEHRVTPDSRFTEWSAHVAVGDCRKEVRVRCPSVAAEDGFCRVGMDYVNAYGGEGYAPNPVGKGLDGGERPALFLPDHYGQDGGFLAATGPLDTRWEQRATYVSRKKKDLALDSDHREHLGWPQNMDRRFFQMAPRDQWSREEAWPAACSFTLNGVGAGGLGYQGLIPPLEVQAVIRRAGEKHFEEIMLKRQTLWFFPDRNLGAVLFSGLIDVEDMLSEEEIDHFLVALSECGAPYSVDYLAGVAARREDNEHKMVEGMKDDALMPPAGHGWAWEYLLSPEDHPRAGVPERDYQQVRERMRHYLTIVASAAQAAEKAKSQNIDEVKQQTHALIRGEGVPETEADKVDWRKQLEAWPREKRRDDLIIRNADLSGMDFSGQSWQGVQLVNVNLEGCRFRGADLRNLVVMGCRMDGLVFENTVLDSCHFNESSLARSSWLGCQLSVVQFIECDFTHAAIREGNWKNCFFSQSRGEGVVIERSVFDSVQMQNCNFQSLSFIETKHEGQVFLDCQLPTLKMRDCAWNKTSWVACNLLGSEFEASRLSTAVFADACHLGQSVWTQCLLEKVFLGEANFSGALAEKCTWQEATMNAVDASKSQWISCDVSRGNLMHANFSGARFDASAFKDANLYGADLTESEFRACNLIGANLGFVRREKNWQKRWKDNLLARVIELPRRPD